MTDDFDYKKQGQLDYLHKQIVEGGNKRFFLVFNNEAGLGKTLKAEKALKELAISGQRALFVRRGNQDGKDSAQRIGNDIALAINADNYKDLKSKIKEYPIVIITHERYWRLSIDSKQRELFTENRDVQIIDEKIDMVKILRYNMDRIEWFTDILPPKLKSLYQECIEEIKLELEVLRTKTFFNAQNNMREKLDELRKQIKELPNRIRGRTLERPLFGDCIITDYTKGDLIKEVDMIENFLNNTCCEDNYNLYTYDSRIQYILLDNNILLDASAGFNYIYKISPLFKIAYQARIVDHSQWTVHYSMINTTANAKSKYIDFYPVVSKHIDSILKPNDKLFICGNKNNDYDSWKTQYSENKRIDVSYFGGNITGSNKWKDCNMIYITHTPNIPFEICVLNYLYYGNVRVSNKGKWTMQRISGSNVFGFRNKEYDKIRKSFLADVIYQCIKRINRDNDFPADVYILNNDQKVIDIVLKQLKNVRYETFELKVKKEKSKSEKYNEQRQEQSKYMEFIKLLSSIHSGVFKKADLRQQLGIINAGNFSRKILNNPKVVDFMKSHNIQSKGQEIMIP